nr:ATP synthase CF1 epsilon subunit [Solanum cajanumense]UNZ90343.1 ATP synthase CF1 epsilon subunit [Solanum cajanumense]
MTLNLSVHLTYLDLAKHNTKR